MPHRPPEWGKQWHARRFQAVSGVSTWRLDRICTGPCRAWTANAVAGAHAAELRQARSRRAPRRARKADAQRLVARACVLVAVTDAITDSAVVGNADRDRRDLSGHRLWDRHAGRTRG